MHTFKLCRSCCTLPTSVTLHRGGRHGRIVDFSSPISSLLGGQVRSRLPSPMNLSRPSAVNNGVADGGGGVINKRHRSDLTRRMGPDAFPGLPPLSASEKSPGATSAPGDDADDPAHGGYQVPVKELCNIVDAPPTPALSFSPKRDSILFLERSALLPLEDLATPELKLAGLRLDPSCNSRSRMSRYTGIKIRDLNKEGELGPERPIFGLPNEPKINYVSWSPDGSHLAFAVRGNLQEEGVNGFGLWVADVKTGKAFQVLGPPDFILNPIFDTFSWVDDSTLVALVVPPSRGPPPKKPLVPSGPSIQSNEKKEVVQNRTFQDLLKDKHDQVLFDYYATAEVRLITLDGKTKPIGPKAVYTAIDPSPDGKFFLVATIQKPYSYIVPSGRFPRKIELWNRNGDYIRDICNLPLAENIPITFNSVRQGRRSVNWRSDKPSSLYWVETQDGGDSKVDVSPRDIVYTQSAKEASDGEEPQVFFKLDLRYGGVAWGNESLALVYESWYKTRKTRTWIASPGNLEAGRRILFDRSSEDVYMDPGSPMMRRTSQGTYVLAQIKGVGGETLLLLNGSGATPEGNIPFLDLFNMESREKERIWQSAKEDYFETVVALMSDQKDQDLTLNELRILVSKESQADPPQYYLRSWPDQVVSQITTFPHPYPQLREMKKEIIRYQRDDGVQLTANLYVPPGYDPTKDGPRPTLIWAYPREFKSKDNASQMRGSRYSFAGIGSTSALLWLARGFVILDGPTMPIIGEGDEEANDSYVEQLRSSAQAAVDEVVKRGVTDRKRIAIGGHSYGAFMTANLLAHVPELFCCGIARAGAYNRTLTPFGFQAEERTLWEAPDTYIKMSPFMQADKIKKPILLIHGEEDNNPGTLTMQSDRFYNALKGHGALTRLVLLPFESHGYQGRESVLHCLWEMDRWLQIYCANPEAEALEGTQEAGSKPVTAGIRGNGNESQVLDDGPNSRL